MELLRAASTPHLSKLVPVVTAGGGWKERMALPAH